MDKLNKPVRRIILTLYDGNERDTVLFLDGDGNLRHAFEVPQDVTRIVLRALSEAMRIEKA